MKSTRGFDAHGLALPRYVLGALRRRGIFAQPLVRVEHQHLTRRYVIRGLESGGAVGDVGHYVTFAREDGRPLEYLHPVESIAPNGLHSVVLAPSLVRIEMLRKARTYELLITRHRPQFALGSNAPALESRALFRGIHGRLELELTGPEKGRAGSVLPVFYTMAGDPIGIPKRFRGAVRAITQAVNCTRCFHCHYLRSATTQTVEHNAPKSVAVSVIPGPDSA
ncbi:MAG TPA: hypothetical protein VN577_01560 [Terriglobales bacterium]|nr:hypothetical protein [Terriglobales bacterium]